MFKLEEWKQPVTSEAAADDMFSEDGDAAPNLRGQDDQFGRHIFRPALDPDTNKMESLLTEMERETSCLANKKSSAASRMLQYLREFFPGGKKKLQSSSYDDDEAGPSSRQSSFFEEPTPPPYEPEDTLGIRHELEMMRRRLGEAEAAVRELRRCQKEGKGLENTNYAGFPNPHKDKKDYYFVEHCELMVRRFWYLLECQLIVFAQVNGSPHAFLEKNKEVEIFDCMMDYIRFQVTSGMYKRTNVSNITHDLFDKNAAIFAFDLTTGQVPSGQEVINILSNKYVVHFIRIIFAGDPNVADCQPRTVKREGQIQSKDRPKHYRFCLSNWQWQLFSQPQRRCGS